MKLKPNISLAGIMGLFFQHVEKMIFGVACFLFLYLGFSGFTKHKSLADRPRDLSEKVKKVKERHTKMAWHPEPPINLEDLFRLRDHPLNLADYGSSTSLNRRVTKSLNPRGNPRVIPVQALEVRTFKGPIAIKRTAVEPAEKEPQKKEKTDKKKGKADKVDPKAEKELRKIPQNISGLHVSEKAGYAGRRYVVIVGLVPIFAQQAEYDENFRDTDSDAATEDFQKSPKWAGYILSKQEITDSGEGAWVSLGNTDAGTIQKLTSDWFAYAKPEVDSRYKDNSVTWPLPPLLLQSLGPLATHSKIPTIKQMEENKVLIKKQGPGVRPKQAPRNTEEAFGGGVAAPKKKPVITKKDAKKPASKKKVALPKMVIRYKLFRVFDKDVEPGKRYRYRVKLALNNPNYGVEERHLENAGVQPKFRLSESENDGWSGPSPEISIPLDTRVLSGPVDLVKAGQPPTANVRVVIWDNRGFDKVGEFKMNQGSVANNKSWEIDVIDPVRRVLVKKEVQFDSHLMLVDLYGGVPVKNEKIKDPKIPGNEKIEDLKLPGMMLFQDKQGNLVLHHYRLDATAYWDNRGPVPTSRKVKPKGQVSKEKKKLPRGRRRTTQKTTGSILEVEKRPK